MLCASTRNDARFVQTVRGHGYASSNQSYHFLLAFIHLTALFCIYQLCQHNTHTPTTTMKGKSSRQTNHDSWVTNDSLSLRNPGYNELGNSSYSSSSASDCTTSMTKSMFDLFKWSVNENEDASEEIKIAKSGNLVLPRMLKQEKRKAKLRQLKQRYEDSTTTDDGYDSDATDNKSNVGTKQRREMFREASQRDAEGDSLRPVGRRRSTMARSLFKPSFNNQFFSFRNTHQDSTSHLPHRRTSMQKIGSFLWRKKR